jgi:hypothetical protein
MVIAAATILAKQAMSAAAFLLAAISIVAGFYFPVSLLPDWMLTGSAWLDVVKLVGFGLALCVPSLWILQSAVRLAQRRGTIIEY